MEVFPTETTVFAAATLDLNPEKPTLQSLNPFLTPVFVTDKGKLAPLDDSEKPQPLPEISFEDEKMTFIEKIYPAGRTAAYLVKFKSTCHFLKVFRDRDPDEEEDSDPEYQVEPENKGRSMLRFRKEKAAYEALIHSDACDRSVVPKCWGWFTLTREHVLECDSLTRDHRSDPEYKIKAKNTLLMQTHGENAWHYLKHSILDDRRRPKGLLLEYIPHAEILSGKNLNVSQIEDIAKKALEGLHVIHQSHVLHGDALRRENLLILQDGSIRWVDFVEAKCRTEAFRKYCPTQSCMLIELARVWSKFFTLLEWLSNVHELGTSTERFKLVADGLGPSNCESEIYSNHNFKLECSWVLHFPPSLHRSFQNIAQPDSNMADIKQELNITRAPIQPLPIVTRADAYDDFRSQYTPLIIDNGSTNLRFGFATSSTPHTGTNVIARYRERRQNKPLLLFGEGVDTEGGAKSQAKTPWEGDVLLNFDALEHSLDYAFIQLGIDAPSIEHPVLMTERLSSPLHSRALTSELMFEQYSVPSLAYCVDSVMSFYHNNLPSQFGPFSSDGLAVSFNSASTSVIPIMDGRGIMSHAKRIPWGATQTIEYLLKLIQLKYPTFPTRVTSSQTSWMLHNFCEFSTDYPALLRKLRDPLNMTSSARVIQFPFTIQIAEEKTEEELARIAERKKEQGRKLQEVAAKTRLERLAQKEVDLQRLSALRERKDEETKKDWAAALREEGLDDDAALDSIIKKLEYDLKRAKKKDGDGDDVEDEPPSFPLIDVPDAELDEDQLKEKRKQKLAKAGYDARERARKEKEREREEKEAEERREEEERDRDLAGWAVKMRKEHEALMSKIKDRSRRKAALNDRKSAASQARMKSIANLAADERVPKKRRKAGGEDMFGADDNDWAIYRKINTAAPSSDEEEDLAQLQNIEQKLLMHDPNFTDEHTHASLSSQRSALMAAFRPEYEEGDVEGKTRIHLNVERWRVCEAWFSPAMAGVDCAGLGEVLQNVLARFSESEKARLVKGMADFAKTEEFAKVGVTKAEYDEHGGERIKRWWGGNWNSASIPM
ncbi:hypothetical protein NLI96_g6604 [Meripilus lineatus]|uniref:Protein kinase domain-containing protein n=1 Tax=Meripilus lineatus TaxID=2056292 RepID=A0AAD5V0L7_9APHY|nr:hypothetical protein NLI96_g6604 [Physisporinus lineatus]